MTYLRKKRMLADVLWEAANEVLWDGDEETDDFDGTEWSCNAVLAAEVGPRFHYEYANGCVELLREKSKAAMFITTLGAPVVSAFDDFEQGAARQGVRYMWLLLAMHVAEDEGIEL